ncbi:MAG: DUF1788 domain-containing protein [Bacilli bacterium]|nr:DUF1788 domain-containing protein [Bacilli bacterium]
MSSIDDKLNKIEKVITNKEFKENKGLGNEVGYYIFDYMPSDEIIVRNHIKYLKKTINNSSKGIKIIEFDLYKIMIEILKEEDYLDICFEKEEEEGFIGMAEAVSESLGLDETNELNLVLTKILENIPNEDCVIFLTGIGKCYPIIRAHNILNNMHQVFDKMPVILFFPGKYSGLDLQIFGTVKDNNYYRAFKFD